MGVSVRLPTYIYGILTYITIYRCLRISQIKPSRAYKVCMILKDVGESVFVLFKGGIVGISCIQGIAVVV